MSWDRRTVEGGTFFSKTTFISIDLVYMGSDKLEVNPIAMWKLRKG